MNPCRLSLAALLLIAPLTHAATVGTMPIASSTYLNSAGDPAPVTLIDLSRPARETASLTIATVRWVLAPSAGCADAFKVKVLRPNATNTSFTVMGERGPFNVPGGFSNVNAVALSPALAVQPGDVLAVTQLRTIAECGAVGAGNVNALGAMFTVSFSDPSSGTVTDTVFGYARVFGFRASDSAEVVEGYLVAAGSNRGAFGSDFKTAVQLTNADLSPINGRFIFHPAGAAASASDPTLPFTIPPLSTITYDDVVAAMGRTGLGSMTVLSTNSHAPDITARVFNDQGTAGTSGVMLEMLRETDALQRFQFGQITTPADLTNFRFNIGIRTLEAGATLSIEIESSNGASLGGPFTRTYPPNFFEQVTASQFVNGLAVPANAVIRVVVTEGSAFLYGSTTDNRTNDPSLKYFTRR